MKKGYAIGCAVAALSLGIGGGVIVRTQQGNLKADHQQTVTTVAQSSAPTGSRVIKANQEPRSNPFPSASAKPVPNSKGRLVRLRGKLTTPPTPSSARESTLGRIGLFQVFDYGMTDAQAQAAAKRTDIVWGSGIGAKGATAHSWSGTLMNARYAYQPADAQMITRRTVDNYNASGHGDWVVYDCDQDNKPTHTPAFQPGIGTAVSIDITNEAAVKDQVDHVADFAKAHGNNAIAFDQTLFFIYDGGQHPNGADPLSWIGFD